MDTEEYKGEIDSHEKHVIDVANHTFRVPEKQISSPDDLKKWEQSQGYSDLLGFILTLNEAVKNKKVSDNYPSSPMVESLLELLEQLEKWIAEIPPIDQPQRFGNKAFRTWFTKLKQEGAGLVKAILPPQYESAVPELFTYLVEGVGNETRIDYGTGHELSFVAFLCCLCKIGAVTEDDHPALVLKVFERYLNVMRRLQLTYRMEPAGSHGVWSLDDYQFLPFLWGSSQLMDHPRIKPKSFPNQDIYEGFYKEYLFLSAIKFINQVKTGPFAEHSNQLWGISGVPNWSKVNSGLIKMYRVEVLAKFPVIQHFLFGSLLTLDLSPNPVSPVSAPPQTSAGIMGAMPSSGGVPYGTRAPPPPGGFGSSMPPPIGARVPPPGQFPKTEMPPPGQFPLRAGIPPPTAVPPQISLPPVSKPSQESGPPPPS